MILALRSIKNCLISVSLDCNGELVRSIELIAICAILTCSFKAFEFESVGVLESSASISLAVKYVSAFLKSIV